jgi:hypothetical protein
VVLHLKNKKTLFLFPFSLLGFSPKVKREQKALLKYVSVGPLTRPGVKICFSRPAHPARGENMFQ